MTSELKEQLDISRQRARELAHDPLDGRAATDPLQQRGLTGGGLSRRDQRLVHGMTFATASSTTSTPGVLVTSV